MSAGPGEEEEEEAEEEEEEARLRGPRNNLESIQGERSDLRSSESPRS